MERKSKFFYTMNNVLKNIIHRRNWGLNLAFYNIARNWEAIVGKNVASHTEVVEIRSNKLFVNVDSPLWSTHLLLLKNKIIENINNKYVKDIYFHNVDSISPKKKVETENEDKKIILKKQIDEKTRLKIKNSVANIKNEELRTKFENFLLKAREGGVNG